MWWKVIKKKLVPKLLSNANLSTECIESTKKEVMEQEDFLQFHENLTAGEHVVNGGFHCSTASTSRETLENTMYILKKYLSRATVV